MSDEIKLEWHNERRKVKDLVPHPNNPRQLTEQQAKVLTKSLEKFNLVEIPAIDTDNTLLAGHQRMKLMLLLGRGDEEIDVRMPNRKLTKEEADSYNILSNKATGEWDWGILANWDEKLLLDSGFTKLELSRGFDLNLKEDEGEDEVPEVDEKAPPIAQLADVWQLGQHRLMCGDATKSEDVDKLMNGRKAQMVFTDPPYNVDYVGGGNYADNGKQEREKIQNDKMTDEQFAEFMDKSLANMFKVTEGVFYICMSSKELSNLKRAFEKNGGHWSAFIIWVKNHFTLSRSDWQNQYEPILYGWNKNITNHYFLGFRDQANVWEGLEKLKPKFIDGKTVLKIGEYHIELEGNVTGKVMIKKNMDIWRENKPAKSTEHPTMKPIKLMEKALIASSQQNDIVLDLFGGSGSTLIACEKTNRLCRMMEIDQHYCDVIIKRWEEMTGQKAVKLTV